MAPRLFGLSGIPQGETFLLSDFSDGFTIGRDEANALTLIDGAVSRRHCVIRPEGEDFWVEDLDSHNHTFVNEAAIVRHLLAVGDRIRLGGSELVFLQEVEETTP
jgi:pSer/pThr/pTyr-binding forkhead associated (FHA) protein